ncbi:hypothetical protein [Alteribacter aurantiacus]|uniref:hypothetical protein n=1 Tax=Alteribacter aurantiacus TaxID=254410 RepID=UPI00040F5460|nr:hypothetical protein [Alteribacter aurantiacus]
MATVSFIEKRQASMVERNPRFSQVQGVGDKKADQHKEGVDGCVELLDHLTNHMFTALVVTGIPYLLFIVIEAFLRLS